MFLKPDYHVGRSRVPRLVPPRQHVRNRSRPSHKDDVGRIPPGKPVGFYLAGLALDQRAKMGAPNLTKPFSLANAGRYLQQVPESVHA